eukprot:gnl/TRDRNA2_/TRDRNA2_171598_c0_seq2.p1 gnl/TRDRNA2_/TRDRNA2_171598_c0~~gnl/TRDRNA2_/TRDRNA2_171598_c0_seq2.p1  ORF type:complete len:158 (-),score=26.47 gnl/TRDRNA2_/TRDRNA2_171598_c0_seq2:104-577(-)
MTGTDVDELEPVHQWCATNAELSTADLPPEYLKLPKCEESKPLLPRCQYIGDKLLGASRTDFMCLSPGDSVVAVLPDGTKQEESVRTASKMQAGKFLIKGANHDFFLTPKITLGNGLAIYSMRQDSEAGIWLESWCAEQTDEDGRFFDEEFEEDEAE